MKPRYSERDKDLPNESQRIDVCLNDLLLDLRCCIERNHKILGGETVCSSVLQQFFDRLASDIRKEGVDACVEYTRRNCRTSNGSEAPEEGPGHGRGRYILLLQRRLDGRKCRSDHYPETCSDQYLNNDPVGYRRMLVKTSEKTEADANQRKTDKVRWALFAHFGDRDSGNNSEGNRCNDGWAKVHSRSSW
jgi:hypothetical protein